MYVYHSITRTQEYLSRKIPHRSLTRGGREAHTTDISAQNAAHGKKKDGTKQNTLTHTHQKKNSLLIQTAQKSIHENMDATSTTRGSAFFRSEWRILIPLNGSLTRRASATAAAAARWGGGDALRHGAAAPGNDGVRNAGNHDQLTRRASATALPPPLMGVVMMRCGRVPRHGE